MKQNPWSQSTKTPGSKEKSLVTMSLCNVTVNPEAELKFPDINDPGIIIIDN